MEIIEIKSRLTILIILQHYGLKPDKNNRLKCPFHNDTTPSLQVYPQTNTWTCFSSNCTAGSGDQIDFIMKYENTTKHQAIMKAKSLLGAGGETTAEELSRIAVLTKIFTSFRSGMQRSQAGKSYAESRGLDPELLEIGYNSGQYHHNGRVNEHLMKSYVKYGLLKPGVKQGYQVFGKHCICFALRNKDRQVTGLYFRSTIETNNDPSQGKHFYLKDRQGFYPGCPDPDSKKLILTESVIDAASLLQLEINNEQLAVLALYGTNGLTEEHKQAIKEWAGSPPSHEASVNKEIILFFDGDRPGRGAVKKHSETLTRLNPGIKLSYIETPDGEDVNSLWVNYGKEAILQLIEERSFLFSSEDTSTEKTKPAAKQINPKLETRNPELNTSNPQYITFQSNNLLFTLLGGINLHQLDRLRVTLKITRNPQTNSYHSIRHTIDLYNDDLLERFISRASERLEIESKTLRLSVAELTEQLEQYRLSRIESLKARIPEKRLLTPEREKRAITYLKSARLLERTGRDIGLTGVVGEETNRLLMYLVFTSRLREQPLHIISLGTSGSGKTYLQERISELIPDHDKLEITILSENAFYYFEQKELRHKLVLIEDMDGAENVLYPLRELQTKRKISKTIPIKDSKGNLKTITLHVEGPICLAGTTTRERLYEDNANRSLLIYTDNSQAHKEAIMDYQRRLSAGKIDTHREHRLKELFKDIQSVIKPVKVRNPYAEQLKIPDHVFKPLRTNAHYLQFIELVTFYHQYQRPLKKAEDSTRYIETTPEDIEWANELLKDVLLAKSDELSRAVREFFEGLKYHLRSTGKESFYVKEVRSRLRLHPMTANRYIRDLENRSYIKRIGGNRKSGYEYEISNYQEYDQLQGGMRLLSDILERIREKEAPRVKEASELSIT